MLLFFLRLIAALPLRMLHAAGRLAGLFVYMLPGRYRDRLQENVRQAGYTEPAFARNAARQTGAMLAETPKVWLHSAHCLTRCTEANPEVLRDCLAEQRGILYLTPHLGCFEITARHLMQFGPLTVMYRPPRQAWLDPVMRASRDLPGLRSVPANMKGVREFVKTLRNGEAIGMLPDQVPPSRDGVWQEFFGRPAYTMTLAAKLALQTQVPVMLVVGERLAKGQGWRIHYVRLAEPYPDSIEGMVARINEAMESLIRRFPEQYLWGYNRYKIPKAAPPLPQPTSHDATSTPTSNSTK